MPARTEAHSPDDQSIDIEKARGSASLLVWFSICTAIFGFGLNYGITQSKATSTDREIAKMAGGIAEFHRAVEVKFDKLDNADLALRQDMNSRSEQSSRVINDNNIKIGVLAEKMQQANLTIERLGASIEKLADQLQRDRNERRFSEK